MDKNTKNIDDNIDDKAQQSAETKEAGTDFNEQTERELFEQQLVAEHSRRLSLNRSPPPEERIKFDLMDLPVSQTPDGAKTGVKRVRSPEEVEKTQFGVLQKHMDEIQRVAKTLYDLAISNSNTKVEIKNGVRDLKKRMERIQLRMETYEQSMIGVHQQTKTSRRDSMDRPKKETKSIGTQVDERMMEDERKVSKIEEEKMCREQLEKGEGWEGLKKVIDLSWPENAYTNTREAQDKKMMEPGDMVIFVDPKKQIEAEIARDVSARFADIRPLIKSGINKVEQLKRKTETINEDGERKEITNSLWVAPLKTGYDTECLYKSLKEVKDGTNTGEERVINIITTEVPEDKYIRKCTEALFHKTMSKIQIWGNKQQQNRKNEQRTEKIIMKTEGKDYASALKGMKDVVNLDRIGVKIKNIRKTAQGDVLLEVMGGKEKAQAFKGEMEKNGGSKVEFRQDTSTIYISDIEAGITEEDVKQVIRENTRKEIGDLRVSLRENRFGNQNAIVTLDRESARDILRRETLQIGWMECRVRARITLTRCYRCLGFGHQTAECKGQDRSENCLNCNEKGHTAKECKNERYCNNCNRKGHRADQMACPVFREEINKRSRELELARKAKRRPTKRTTIRASLDIEDEVFTG